jgi:hypothetical protein
VCRYAYINGHGTYPDVGEFCKPGSNNYSESTIFRPTLTKLMVRGSAHTATAVLAQLTMPSRASQIYGKHDSTQHIARIFLR